MQQNCDSQLYTPVLQAKNEVKVLAALKHVNIVRYYECYAGKNYANFKLFYCITMSTLGC